MTTKFVSVFEAAKTVPTLSGAVLRRNYEKFDGPRQSEKKNSAATQAMLLVYNTQKEVTK